MSTRTTLIVCTVLWLVAVVATAAAYPSLPEPMATHWGLNDQVNGSMPRFWGAFLIPLMVIPLTGLFFLVPLIDPMKANIATFRPIFNVFIALFMVFMFFTHALVILWNLGYAEFRMTTVLLPALGLLFIFLGVMMRRVKRNYFIGIRTPWTLSSDRVWDETHRVGSLMFVACGVIAVFGAFLPGFWAFVAIFLPLMLATSFLLAYSYSLYQKETRGK